MPMQTETVFVEQYLLKHLPCPEAGMGETSQNAGACMRCPRKRAAS